MFKSLFIIFLFITSSYQFPMSLLSYVLSPVYQQYLHVENKFDSRVAPKNLIKELQHKSTIKKFTKIISKPTSNPLKIVRRLHVCNLLLMYSDLFGADFTASLSIPLSTDEWLNEQFIKPYLQFLIKCSNEYEKYSMCKKSFIDQSNILDQLFFLINLLKLLFKSISKIALFGKFYRPKSPIIWQGVIQMIAIQAKELYFVFKNILITILQDTDKFLFTEDLQKIMKIILIKDLDDINEEMKQLLLGKEFFPYGKAIGIKLFRIDEATTELQDTMRGIVTDHCETNRRMQKQEMQDKLFNHKKGFNIKFFEQSLRGSGNEVFKAFGKNKHAPAKQASQEMVESGDEDPEQENGKNQPETNESNVNKAESSI